MVFSPGDPAQSETTNQKSHRSQASEFDTEQMFRLIDSILPFEACLYHQILPLALEGKSLKLGMVNPQDFSALDYARRIFAYLNCSLKPQLITSEVHQSFLSAYLNYSSNPSSAQQAVADKLSQVDRQSRSTLILDDAALSTSETGEPLQPSLNQPPTQSLPKPGRSIPRPLASQRSRSENADAKPQHQTVRPQASPSWENLPRLDVQAQYASQPLEFLATLPPRELLSELLGRVLIDGIGRLYFERQQQQGRILWSQNGVLQSVLEALDLSLFQGVINEVKRLALLPALPVQQAKSIEVERRYRQERLLLRLRVMPGTYGEEATLQVLRGAALKFYQRQQLDKLSADALGLAQQLQRKLGEIRDRARINPSPLEALPALNQVLEGVDQQLEALEELQTKAPEEE
jgi:type II secretory ATPase GspE/PulE/Tfp pilus assembly ATPase PilB-like protein